MTRAGLLFAAGAASILIGAGGVVASALSDMPQDAQPVQDVTADLNRQTPPTSPAPQEPAPEAQPAPTTPIAITPAVPPLIIDTGKLDAEDAAETDTKAAEVVPEKAPQVVEPTTPLRRQRLRVAIVEAVDKVTAERMRFEVAVGGRPVRFQKSLIFTAKACEVATPDELVDDSVAYLEVSVQPRGVLNRAEPRQIFRGWMFASSPAVSGIEHPVYDAWVVGCKA